MAEQDLAGKLVLVTGGAKNVGKAISRRFAERGAHVIVNFFHSLDASRQTVAELRAEGFSVEAMRASVAQKAQVDRMFDEIEARHGRLDILVNNAASGALLGLHEIAEEHFDRALDTNLKGAFWCARRASALMARSGGGAIVNVSSVGATLVPAHYLVVGTSKAALESLTRYLAVEFAPLNIRVNTASATLIDGAVADMFPDPEATRQSSIAATPLKRLATAQDMANLVLFLASDAARWVTGQVVVADGGLSLCSEALSPRRLPAVPAAAAPEAAAQAGVEPPDSDDIAIVGMGLALPGASELDEFWKVLMEGTELFGNVPPDRWDYRSFHSPDPSAQDKSYQSRSVFIEGFRPAPALQAEIDAGTAPAELTTLWLRHALMRAMEGVHRRAGDRGSFLVGYTADGSQHLEEAMVLAATRQRLSAILDEDGTAPDERARCLAQVEQVLQARYHRGAAGLAEYFPHRVGQAAMRGVLPDDTECMMIDTACSSSLYSIDIGVKGLLLGQHDVAVCGGAFALAPRGSVLFSKLHGLSRSGEVRPLDKACDGVLFADGAGVVVLKKLRRAVADGDRVLAVLKAFGSSSDGKGKAIYAPNSAGQGIAIRRAYAQAAQPVPQVDWVVAHATGTPAGDLAEFQSLRETLGRQRPVQVTSNKSLVGHTGWAAGVVSLIQVVLALRHQVIPPQHRFAEPPAAFGIEDCSLRIPTTPVAWPPRPGSARMAAVSGFGFGGTNGHLVVAEHRPELPALPPRALAPAEPLVIVGWSARLPGLADDEAVAAWLRGDGPAPAPSFGDSYPLPPFERVRMPGAVLRALDRCQLMSLDAAHVLRDRLSGFWQSHADTIGVVMGHMGPTRNAALYASRCYLDDIDTALQAADPAVRRLLGPLRQRTQALVPPTTENSFPGMMPNVIPARVANYHDLHGANMTVDAGHASTLAAFQVAARYLRCHEFDMVLVGGIHGNTAEEVLPAFGAAPAEAVVLFAVMTASRARSAGLAPLARVEVDASLAGGAAPTPFTDAAGRPLTFAGAEGALAVLRALVRGEPSAVVSVPNPGDRGRFALRVSAAQPAAAPAQPDPARLPQALHRTDQAADGQPLGVQRHRIEWQAAAWQPGPRPLQFLPPGAVVITDDAALAAQLVAPSAEFTVLCTAPLPAPRPGWHQLPAAEADRWPTLLPTLLPAGARHLRLLTSLQASSLPDSPAAGAEAVLQRLPLHDLAFLAVKCCADALAEDGSFITLLLDAVAGEAAHPDAGLFTGLTKSLAIEMPKARVLALLSAQRSVAPAVAEAERES
ncbi:MAG: SDR family oxidoreductase, partial [Aquincola tertiaricarbonis]